MSYKYAAYPKQRDLAQVFVRWALDHVKDNGVIGYNISDTWLNVKTSDGAKKTRQLINGRIREICNDELITRYSEHQGGNVNTMIITINHEKQSTLILNGNEHTYGNIQVNKFLDSLVPIEYPFKTANILKYTDGLHGYRSLCKKEDSKYKEFIFADDGGTAHMLVCKRVFGGNSKGGWKLIKTDNIKQFANTNIDSEVKSFIVQQPIASWALGYMSTTLFTEYMKEYFRDGGKSSKWVVLLAAGPFKNVQIPDYDYYSKHFPTETQAFIDWVEINMLDKDRFLAGIDAEFDKILALPNDLEN